MEHKPRDGSKRFEETRRADYENNRQANTEAKAN
jgi:hypothetical protein